MKLVQDVSAKNRNQNVDETMEFPDAQVMQMLLKLKNKEE